MGSSYKAFDPETLSMLKRVFDQSIAALPTALQTPERKSLVASRLLRLAARGERDPVRLRTAALIHAAPIPDMESRAN
jgi:hypothetical protein